MHCENITYIYIVCGGVCVEIEQCVVTIKIRGGTR